MVKYFTILVFTCLIFLGNSFFIKAQSDSSPKLFFISDCQEPMKVERLFREAYRNEEARDSLFSDILRQRPTNLFILGDITSAGSNKKSWYPVDSFLYKLQKQNVLVNAIPGNHEYYTNARKGIKNYLKRFPEKSLSGYCIKIDSMAIVLLNSNFKKLTSPERKKQQAWYDKTLDTLDSDPGTKVVLVCAHHAPYTNSKVTGKSMTVIQNFVPEFRHSLKTKVFLTGHSHNLEYFKDSVNKYFLVIGGGGGLKQPLLLKDESLYSDLVPQDKKPLYFYVTIERKGNYIYIQAHGLHKDFNVFDILEIGEIAL
jgi:hypothetical protein